MDVQASTGAGYGEGSPGWLAQRNGSRDRTWEIRAATVELDIPSSGRAAISRASWSGGEGANGGDPGGLGAGDLDRSVKALSHGRRLEEPGEPPVRGDRRGSADLP
jgi:hypothetical protein